MVESKRIQVSPNQVRATQVLLLAAALLVLWNAIYGGLRFPESAVSRVLTTMVSTVCVLIFAAFVVQVFEVIRSCIGFFGGFSQVPWQRFSRIQRNAVYRNSDTTLTTLALAILLLIVAYGTLFGWSHVVPVVLVYLVVAFNERLLTRIQPPAVLLLGNSSPELFELHKNIDNAIGFHRAVNLLNPHVEHVFSNTHLAGDLMRTRDDVSWENTIKQLCDMCPIIVVHPTSAYLARWRARILSLKYSISRKP